MYIQALESNFHYPIIVVSQLPKQKTIVSIAHRKKLLTSARVCIKWRDTVYSKKKFSNREQESSVRLDDEPPNYDQSEYEEKQEDLGQLTEKAIDFTKDRSPAAREEIGKWMITDLYSSWYLED